jgi:hypothetical protein
VRGHYEDIVVMGLLRAEWRASVAAADVSREG